MILLTIGILLALLGTLVPMFLSKAPSSIQTNTILQPAGIFIIDNQNKIVLGGVVLIVLSVFVFRGRG